MTTVSAGTTGKYIFSNGDAVTITLDPAEIAQIEIVDARGKPKSSAAISGTRTLGPFAANDVMTLTATRGDVDYTVIPDQTLMNASRAAGRPTVRGRRVVLLGGSETARGFDIRATPSTGVTFNASTQTITVQCNSHNLHSGAQVFLANENAIAPALQNGLITADNGFSLGNITVLDANNFTMPFWLPALAGTAYETLSGTSTTAFAVHKSQQYSATGKFNEMNRWLGHPFTLIANIATGSNNTMNFVERIPALVYMARNNQFDELRGTLGVGNTLLYGLNHSWTVAQLVAQITNDITAIVSAVAQYGICTTLELTPTQLNSTGFTTAGTQAVIEVLRQLATDPAMRLTLEDDFTLSMDPATGFARTRYQLNGSDNVHPSNEGCVTYGYSHARVVQGVEPPSTFKLARSALDNYKSDPASKQLFDPLLAGTTLVNVSTVNADGKCTGQVPEIVRSVVTTGNGARAIAFTYEKIGEIYYIVATITAVGSNDTFTITLSNPAGSRGLETLLSANPGGRFFCGCDYGFAPGAGGPGAWSSVGVYCGATMTYGSITNRTAYLSADSINDTAYPDGPLTGPRMGPSSMPLFTLPSDANFSCSVAGINVVVQAAAGVPDIGVLYIGLPTMRRIN